MSGLDKIVGHITGTAEAEVKEILEAAKAKAYAIEKEAAQKTIAECDRIKEKSEREAANIIERGNASAELKRKQQLLIAKQSLIKEVISKAALSLQNLSDAEYFEVLKKLFKKHLPTQDAVILFSEKDLKRLPDGFVDELSAMLLESGHELKLGGKAPDIKSGFILDFGGVEENLSFEALMDNSMELLMDKVNKELFM
ncbi:MAG: V-type ATP synthase subunit E family protein [Eubacteriales bacterium]|nr:V-type ATP synthase subunit E family protein [Eubacteriales bacterium]